MVKRYHSSLTTSNTADPQAITFRLDRPVYDALVQARETTGTSMNSLVNQALVNYLIALPPDNHRDHYQEAIRKLSGL